MTTTAGTGAGAGGTRFMVQWEEHPMHLATRLGYLLEHQSLVDVTLMCNTHTLKVHRSVLAACSPYFESVLQRQLGNHPLIVLKDMKFCVLKSLIEFMYCGETSVTEENLNPLMEAAKFFEVKGLCTMSKEVLGGERPSINKPVTASTMNGTNNSIADIIPTTYRGRGRRPGLGRGRRNLTTVLGPPQAETAQIMLSLSGNPTTPTLQTTSRNVRISPNSRLASVTGSTVLESSKLLRNGSLTTPDLKALREQLNLEPRRRGRRRTNFGLGRGRIRDIVDTKFGIQTIKKEMDDIQSKDGVLYKPLESKVNLLNNNGNTDVKSPLLASLLSKAEALAKAKVKTEKDTEENAEQETVLYQFDGESSGASKYLEALKEAGLPTDVPVLIENGDGNYVTLTEDVLMNVLGNNEEFQFQVTEATLEQGDVSEGVVLQDGTIMMTGKNKKTDLSGSLLTFGKKSIPIKGVREIKGGRPRTPKSNELFTKEILTPTKLTENNVMSLNVNEAMESKNTNKKSSQELINEAVLESLKSGAANETEADPDAVVMYEITNNKEVAKFVISSKDISALKALNEQFGKQKKDNSPGEKKSLLPTMVDGNTNIAEIKLAIPKNSRKSIVSEVLARAHSLENQAKTDVLNDPPPRNDGGVKNEVNSPQMLDMNIASDMLNDSSQLLNINPSKNNLENPNIMDLGDESQTLDENNLVVLNEENHILQLNEEHGKLNLTETQNLHTVNENNQMLQEENNKINMSENQNLIEVNQNDSILEQQGLVDLVEEPSQDTRLMQINENLQDEVQTQESNGETEETIDATRRDMPLLENESQLVQLELIDGNGEKIEGVFIQKQLSELTGLSEQGKNANVIELLDMVCEGVETQDTNQVLTTVSQSIPNIDSAEANATTSENINRHTHYSSAQATKVYTQRNEHLVMEDVHNLDSRHLQSHEISLDEQDCQEISVEQALEAMMGDENMRVEEEELNQEETSDNSTQDVTSVQQPAQVSESSSMNTNSFIAPIVYSEQDENLPPQPDITSQNVDSETLENSLPVLSTNVDSADLGTNTNIEEIPQENNESNIISPTKDVPYAVGLLRLEDALVQIQSIPDYQPRKTRSGSTSKVEFPSTGTKRRSSVETSIEGLVKRRKSVGSEDDSHRTNQLAEERTNVYT